MSQASNKVKAYELRKQPEATLLGQLESSRRELVSLRTSKLASAPQVKLARIKVVRKNIAKCLTVLNEKRRDDAKKVWKNKKYTPKDLRVKYTKSFRSGLSKDETKLLTVRAQKKAANFKLRKFPLPYELNEKSA